MKGRRWFRTGWAAVTAGVLLLALLGPVCAPYSPTASGGPPFRAPSARHLLGTDVVGRDVLSRVMHGGLPLLSIASLALAVAYSLGVTFGLLAGLRRPADRWIMRPVDAIVVMPWFLMLAVIATAIGAGPAAIVLTSALASVPWIIRIVRTAVLEVVPTGYVESARARGEPLWRLALVEVLPSVRSVVLADAGVRVSMTISMVAVSGFLGLGLRPPSADWALMITENRPGFALQPWAVLAPAVLIMALVVSVNMVTDRALGLDRPPTRWTPTRTRADDIGLEIEALTVLGPGGDPVLDDVSVRVRPGRGLAVIGPSGAGKSTLASAVLGALPPGMSASGTVSVGAGASGRRTVGYVPQDPASGLNPALRVGTAIGEIARPHGGMDRRAAVARALRRVGLPDDRAFRRRFPHQLSGGQQQRVLLAMALVAEPAVLVLDEPTTGLDAATRTELVDMVRGIRRDTAITLLVITHDLSTVAPLIDDVLELERGAVISLASYRAEKPMAATISTAREFAVDAAPVLRATALRVGYRRGNRFGAVADGLAFDVRPGECLALTGPSGAGKTTVARALAGLHPAEDGVVELDGQRLARHVDRRSVDQRRAIQLIFQNPATSLNPAYRVGAQIARPLRLLRGMDVRDAARETERLLEAVRLDPVLAQRRPDSLSGGQQQRVAIARALAAGPRVLICDEITASLDARTGDVVLDLLDELREQGLALVLISHQARVIERLADATLAVDGGARAVSARG
ncbi:MULTISPECIES: ABC transporter ATP-binding protein/permease [Nocardia]|uniref:ABC transporter ATP-binding protein/permease n=1 Tax=Nocardia TaxID=1817 RepID=UPI000D69767D|nr:MULTISPECIES: ATP-binding cassette domain-containing protein [Nocardia]